jgi:hypothetical protein
MGAGADLRRSACLQTESQRSYLPLVTTYTRNLQHASSLVRLDIDPNSGLDALWAPRRTRLSPNTGRRTRKLIKLSRSPLVCPVRARSLDSSEGSSLWTASAWKISLSLSSSSLYALDFYFVSTPHTALEPLSTSVSSPLPSLRVSFFVLDLMTSSHLPEAVRRTP